MKLGDFFKSATHAKSVNPKPVTFTAFARGAILPGGTKNPNPNGMVTASLTGAFTFLSGADLEQARADAQAHLRELYVDAKTKLPLAVSDDDFDIEVFYQIQWRALREWDEQTKSTGDRLFPSVDNLRDMVVIQEISRLQRLYNEYVKEEHPEGGVDRATFRGAQDRSKEVAG